MGNSKIKAVLFDFGGVLAEEGFKEGLQAIADQNKVDPEEIVSFSFDLIYKTGFVLGRVREDIFWNSLREKFPIRGTDEELREEILDRFRLRSWMLDIVSHLKKRGIITAILSDQCNWLDDLDRRCGFFNLFDHVFNSYHMGSSKKELKTFDHVIEKLGVESNNILFIDDYKGHTERAESRGLRTILYLNKELFIAQLNEILGKEK